MVGKPNPRGKKLEKPTSMGMTDRNFSERSLRRIDDEVSRRCRGRA